jgi:hypothetical protein
MKSYRNINFAGVKRIGICARKSKSYLILFEFADGVGILRDITYCGGFGWYGAHNQKQYQVCIKIKRFFSQCSPAW